jgi:glycosyltransferase involved in cell wall biosynthesis
MDAAYVEKIRRQIETQDLTPRVDLLGTLDSVDLAELLARSHLLAVPSSFEGFGIVYLEGMSFGLPAIASTAGGAQEVINPGRDGFLVAPEDATALAGHLERLILDRGLLLEMSLAAQANFRRHPTWEESLSSIHHFLHSLKA